MENGKPITEAESTRSVLFLTNTKLQSDYIFYLSISVKEVFSSMWRRKQSSKSCRMKAASLVYAQVQQKRKRIQWTTTERWSSWFLFASSKSSKHLPQGWANTGTGCSEGSRCLHPARIQDSAGPSTEKPDLTRPAWSWSRRWMRKPLEVPPNLNNYLYTIRE